MENIIYLEEELPEISISEYVSQNEYITQNNKIGINVHPDDELIDQISILIKSLKDIQITNKRKTEAFLNIHKNVITPKQFVLSKSAIPKMFIERKLKYRESNDIPLSPIDNEDTLTFIETYKKLRKIDNYKVRQDEIRKHFFNFVKVDVSGDVINPPKLTINSPHQIQLNTIDNVTILPDDNITSEVSSITINKGINSHDINFKKLTLKDKIETKLTKLTELKTDNFENIEQIIDNFTNNNWNDILESKTELSDLYTLWKEFIEYGIDIDNLSEKHWNELLNRLEKIKDKEKEITFLKPLEYNPQSLNIEYNNIFVFYLIHKQLIEKYLPVMNILKNGLLSLYSKYIETIPPLTINTSNLPKTLYELSTAIYENRIDIENIIEIIKITTLKSKLENLEKWMKSVEKWDGDKIQDLIITEINKFEKTKKSIYDEINKPLNTLTSEIDSIKKGEVISIENTSESDDIVTDNIFNEDKDIIIEDDDNTDEISIQLYDDKLPVDITHLDDSQKELLEIAIRMMIDLQKSSGISLNFEEIFNMIPYKARLSKLSLFKNLLPEYSEDFLTKLTNYELVKINTFIENNVEPVNYSSVKEALEKVSKQFSSDLFDYISLFIATWVTEIQKNVLNKTIDFKIWNGNIKCIQSWSPYGMPMEGLSNKREGVIPYILCIIDELKQTDNGNMWNKYGKDISKDRLLQSFIKIYESSLKETVNNLQKEFKLFDKEYINRNLLEKADKIKKQLIDTVAQRNKKNYLNDYMNFLKHLPSVLVQSSIAKKIHIGCCLQHLNEKYRSDYDWSILVGDAYRIKKLYATQRFGTEKRPILTKVLKDFDTMTQKEYILPYHNIEYEIKDSEKVREWLNNIQKFIPVKDYNDILSNIMNTETIVQKYMNIYNQTVGKSYIENAIIDDLSIQELLQMYRKTIEIQYRNIKDNKYNNHEQIMLSRWNDINELSEFILSIDGYYNETEEQNAKYIIQYCLIRQLCFPAKPEYAENNTLISDIDIPNSDTILFIQDTKKDLLKWSSTKLFNKHINYNDYINKKREQENLEKLNLIDTMNPEERKIYIEAKKLGILELQEYLEQFKEDQNEDNDEHYETIGEEEFYPKQGENSDETNLDSFNDNEY